MSRELLGAPIPPHRANFLIFVARESGPPIPSNEVDARFFSHLPILSGYRRIGDTSHIITLMREEWVTETTR